MKITGRITQMQSITGTIKVMSDSINSTVGDVVCINGTISRQTKRLSGTVKNPSHVHGIINKPSGQGKNDHVFVIVDLLKMHEQRIIYHNANVVVSLTAQSSQPVSKQIDISAVPVVVAVNSVTAGYASFSNNSITVQSAIAIKEEVNE